MTQLRRGVLLSLVVLLAGCGGGGGGSSAGAAVAGIGSAPPTIRALQPGGQPVQTQAALNVYTALRELYTLSALVIPADPALRGRAFLAQNDGSIHVLQLGTGAPTRERLFDVPPTITPPGTSTLTFPAGFVRQLVVQDASTALLVTCGGRGTGMGGTGEAVLFFDPLTARGPQDVTRWDFDALTVTWPAGARDFAGNDVSGQALPLFSASSAVVAGGALFVSFDNGGQPGAVLSHLLSRAPLGLSRPQVLDTSRHHPSGLTRVATPQGDVVLCVNQGIDMNLAVAGPGPIPPGSIDVISAATHQLVGTIEMPGSALPSGQVCVSADGRRGYVGSALEPHVYTIDLEGIGGALANTSRADLSARYLGGFALPAGPRQTGLMVRNMPVTSLGLSHSGRYLYATLPMEGALMIVDLQAGWLVARTASFRRSLPGSPGLANDPTLMAVRPGQPGVDFQGPSIFVGTLWLDAADQAVRDVTSAVDAITVDRH